MRLVTDSPLRRAQHAAQRAWLESVVPPARPRLGRRVLVTGFGRFGEHDRNASGEVAVALLPGVEVPRFPAPMAERVFSPEPQFVVACGTVAWPGYDGDIALCTMILPVLWDVAAAMVLRTIAHFDPEVVVMNGVAGPRQALWLELGASNQAAFRYDASELLRPVPEGRVVEGATPAIANHASFPLVMQAAREALQQGPPTLQERLPSVELVGFPRPNNSYVCNATTYAVAHGLAHPGRPLSLMEGSVDQPGMTIVHKRDRAHVPHFFSHWPSDIPAPEVEAAAAILRAMIVAQLRALDEASPVYAGDAIEPTLWPTTPA